MEETNSREGYEGLPGSEHLAAEESVQKRVKSKAKKKGKKKKIVKRGAAANREADEPMVGAEISEAEDYGEHLPNGQLQQESRDRYELSSQLKPQEKVRRVGKADGASRKRNKTSKARFVVAPEDENDEEIIEEPEAGLSIYNGNGGQNRGSPNGVTVEVPGGPMSIPNMLNSSLEDITDIQQTASVSRELKKTAAFKEEHIEEHRQLSTKSLGKRKAGSTADTSRKRFKRGTDKGAPNGDIRTFVTSSPEADIPSESSHFVERSEQASGLTSTRNSTGKAAPATATYGDSDVLDESDFYSALKEPLSISESGKRRKRRLPVDEPGSPSRSTPRQRAKAKTPKSGNPRTTASEASKTAATPKSKFTIDPTALETIKTVIENHRAMKGWSQREINNVIHKSGREADSVELWSALVDEVSGVPKRKIMDTCRRIFHNFERGGWTQEQDDELIAAFKAYPNKWKQIGEALNRFPEDVRDRWRNYLVCGDNLRHAEWDQEEEGKLESAIGECLDQIRKHRRNQGIETDANAEELIDWNIVSAKLGHTRSRQQCRGKWKQILKRREVSGDDDEPVSALNLGDSWRVERSEQGVYQLSADEKLKLLRAVVGSGASSESKIPWNLIRLEMKQDDKRMTWRVCLNRLCRKVEGYEHMKFTEILDELVDAFETSVPDEPEGYNISRNSKSTSVPRSRRVNGERPSTSMRKTQRRIRDDHSGEALEPAAKSKKPKLIDQLRGDGDPIQDTNIHEPIDEDLLSFGTARKRKQAQTYGKTPTRKAKSPLIKPRKSQVLSAERVVEDDISDDETPTRAAYPVGEAVSFGHVEMLPLDPQLRHAAINGIQVVPGDDNVIEELVEETDVEDNAANESAAEESSEAELTTDGDKIHSAQGAKSDLQTGEDQAFIEPSLRDRAGPKINASVRGAQHMKVHSSNYPESFYAANRDTSGSDSSSSPESSSEDSDVEPVVKGRGRMRVREVSVEL
ncbi:hypothetical protein B0O99DRAFT_633571 [Bisporella sp. PMI_857]|nr:hypothetical protein B0O99DRAFT_633571 [Bisporella sp. PMI_857]